MIPTTQELYAYDSSSKQNLKREISTNIAYTGRVVNTSLYVFNGANMWLISFEADRELKIILVNETILCRVTIGSQSDIVEGLSMFFFKR